MSRFDNAKQLEPVFPPDLKRDFSFNNGPHGDHWQVYCKTCGLGWKLFKTFPQPYIAPLEYHALSHRGELPAAPPLKRARIARTTNHRIGRPPKPR